MSAKGMGGFESRTTVRRPAEKGYRGTRLGSPYVYRWVDLEPTNRTWRNRSEWRSFWGAVLGFVLVSMAASFLWGERGFILGSLFLGPFGMGAGGMVAQFWGRTDTEPVPKEVQREAYIEYDAGDFNFVLEEDGKVFFFQRWELVRQFEKVDYWAMFGDAGKSPYNTGWHAIVMTPLVGKPWLIASTIEGDAELRDRFTNLDARFSADTRAVFMRALEARKSAVSAPKAVEALAPTRPEDSPKHASETEPRGITHSVPEKL